MNENMKKILSSVIFGITYSLFGSLFAYFGIDVLIYMGFSAAERDSNRVSMLVLATVVSFVLLVAVFVLDLRRYNSDSYREKGKNTRPGYIAIEVASAVVTAFPFFALACILVDLVLTIK